MCSMAITLLYKYVDVECLKNMFYEKEKCTKLKAFKSISLGNISHFLFASGSTSQKKSVFTCALMASICFLFNTCSSLKFFIGLI